MSVVWEKVKAASLSGTCRGAVSGGFEGAAVASVGGLTTYAQYGGGSCSKDVRVPFISAVWFGGPGVCAAAEMGNEPRGTHAASATQRKHARKQWLMVRSRGVGKRESYPIEGVLSISALRSSGG